MPVVGRALLGIELDRPVASVPALFPYDDYLSTWFAPLRFQLIVVSLLAAAGGVLAMIGLYALIAFAVAGRTREIGIRTALGETSRSIAAAVVGYGVALSVAGVVVGTAAALALRRALGSLGVAIETSDP